MVSIFSWFACRN